METPVTYIRDPDVVMPSTPITTETPIDVNVIGGTLVANVVMSSSPQPIKDGVGAALSTVQAANGATAVTSNVLLVQHVDDQGNTLRETTQDNIDLNTANAALVMLDLDETGSRQLAATTTGNSTLSSIQTNTSNISADEAAIRQCGTRIESLISTGNATLSGIQTDALSQSGTRVTLVDSHQRPFESYTDSEGEQHLGVSIRQSVYASIVNSSSQALPFGGTFLGSPETTLGISGIQVSLKADQNANCQVDQSPDGINWDISDQFTYYQSLGGDSWTIQAVSSYYRTHIINSGSGNMSYMRLQTALCPTVEALPRALTAGGNLKVATQEFVPTFGQSTISTPHQQIQTATAIRLAGASFSGTNPIESVDTNYWAKTRTGADADATVFEAQGTLATGTTANGSILLNSVRVARFVTGCSLKYRGVIVLPPVTGANTRRWGAFDTSDGYFFEHDGSTLYLVSRKSGVDVRVPNGSFNGDQGSTLVLLSNTPYTFEIYWTNKGAWFFQDGIIIHKMSSSTYPLVGVQNLKVGSQCVNTGANSAVNRLLVRSSGIVRLGQEMSQVTSAFQAGQIASRVLKYGAGNLRGGHISGVTATSVATLYDAVSVDASKIIWSSGVHVNNQSLMPYDVSFYNLPFSTGLTLAVTAAALNMLVVYE